MEFIPQDRRPWTENELRQALTSGQLPFPPAQLHYWPVPLELGFDGGLEVRWKGFKACYAYEYKASSTPKSLELALFQLRKRKPDDPLPLVILPYLSELTLQKLDKKGVSGLDLCGNGLLLSSSFALSRTGLPNLFKEPASLRNVFRNSNTSSILTRCFLLKEKFSSLSELQEFAQNRLRNKHAKSTLTKGTVSKVVQVLDEERIVGRSSTGVRLLDREGLLLKLEDSYRNETRPSVLGSTPLKPGAVWGRLDSSSLMHIGTGTGSAHRYGLISPGERMQLYVEDLQAAALLLDFEQTPLFPNLELIEEKSPVVYFDARVWGDESLASPIQVWLELSRGEPREQVAAGDLRARLLDGEVGQYE